MTSGRGRHNEYLDHDSINGARHRTLQHVAAMFDLTSVLEQVIVRCRKGSLRRLRDKSGPLRWRADDLDARGEFGWTPLSIAAACGNKNAFEVLLATGDVDINAIDDDERTPLYLAEGNGHVAVVKALLSTDNVDVNIADDFHRTLLHLAARSGDQEVLQALLASGKLHVNAKSELGRTALHVAAGLLDVDVVQILLYTNDIDVNARDIHGRTAFMDASTPEIAETPASYGKDRRQCERQLQIDCAEDSGRAHE